jgi:hypothetical protein
MTIDRYSNAQHSWANPHRSATFRFAFDPRVIGRVQKNAI